METSPRISPDTTVNEILKQRPEAVATLNALGIDTCCGGSSALHEAAAEAGVSIDDVLRALAPAGARA
jgi:iron-sulfur cluster repair protein YtfE (RIC family)